MKFNDMQHLRRDYTHGELHEDDLPKNPLQLFDAWFRDALAAKIDMADAMALATISPDKIPAVRIVALRSYNDDGFVFHTNYHSNKGIDINSNKNVASVFYWKELDRQVRIVGTAHKIPRKDSDQYFSSRPPKSNYVQIASLQSQVVESKEIIRKRVKQLADKYKLIVISKLQPFTLWPLNLFFRVLYSF